MSAKNRRGLEVYSQQRSAGILRSAVFWNDPDVSESHGAAVILKQDRPAGNRFFLKAGGRRAVLNLIIVVNADTVLPNGDSRFCDHIAGGIEFRRGEINVIPVPGFRRLKRERVRILFAINRPAAAVLVRGVFPTVQN